jgi:hypothetical protein
MNCEPFAETLAEPVFAKLTAVKTGEGQSGGR